jgi:hypothetical protein
MTPTDQPDRSPAPGIIPGPVHVSDGAAAPAAATEKRDEPKGRRNPVRTALAKVMSALHGDKYMVDAYPAAGPESAGRSDDARSRTR